MANIKFSDLNGSNLLLDEESYLNELSDEVAMQTKGGVGPTVAITIGTGIAVTMLGAAVYMADKSSEQYE